jgi:hypothetical protein
MATNARRFLFPFLFLLCLFLSLNKHSKSTDYDYHAVIWADVSGYYVHLPNWFLYHNDPSVYPENIDKKTGDGFYLDKENGKVITKYPCGVALLVSPFFLTAHMLAAPLGFEADGFSLIYSILLMVAGVFYFCLGAWLLMKFLRRHFSPALSIAVPLILFLCTNLFYYTIDDPGMSHVYSFFLMALFIYSVQVLIHAPRLTFYLAFAFSITLLILIRPTNAMILLFPAFYEGGALFSGYRALLKNKTAIVLAIMLCVLLVLPQLYYLNQTYHSFFAYSYGEEGFNWLQPQLLKTWFSTNNGLFPYAPVLLLSVAGMIMMIRKREKLGWYSLLNFLLISYIFSSWWCWWFGCSFGARSFVEFYTLLAIPMAFLLKNLDGKRMYAAIGFIALCFFINMDIEYYYDGCFYGGDWDIKSYVKLLTF